MPSTLSVKSLLVMGFHTHTHTDTLYATHVSILVTASENNEVIYIYDIPECCMHVYVPC